MDDQERNHEALIDRFAEQARIIRHRNDRIAEVEARANELALELAHAATRAEKAEQERDEARGALRARLGMSAQPRPLTPTDEMVERGRSAYWGPTYGGSVEERVRAILTAALTEPPTRPEGAERWEDFLIDSLDYQALTDQQIADLADRIAEEMNR